MKLSDLFGTGKDLQGAAERYADTLKPGDRIIEAVDGPWIDDFRHLLPAALIARGLRAESVEGGLVIRALYPRLVYVHPTSERSGWRPVCREAVMA